METFARLAILMMLTVGGTIATAAREAKALDLSTPAAARVRDDNMTPYRNLATDTVKALKANDLVMARKKAKELETAWDKNENELKKESRELWNQIDKAMDDFIKPLNGKAPDADKEQAAYDVFIAKLKLAVKR